MRKKYTAKTLEAAIRALVAKDKDLDAEQIAQRLGRGRGHINLIASKAGIVLKEREYNGGI